MVKLVALFVTTGLQKQEFNALNHDIKTTKFIGRRLSIKIHRLLQSYNQKLSNVKEKKTLFDVETYYMDVNRSGSEVTTSRLHIKFAWFPSATVEVEFCIVYQKFLLRYLS